MKQKFNIKIYFSALFLIACIVSLVWSADGLIEAVGGDYAEQKQSPPSKTAIAETERNDRLNNTIIQVNDYERIAEQVAKLGQSKDLEGLKKLETSADTSRVGNDSGLYTELMIKICGAYNTYNFNDKKQYVLARKCVKNALRKLEEMPIGRAVNLVAQLGGDTEYVLGIVPESNWEADRAERMNYWFRAWQLLDKAVIKDFNFEANRPVYHPQMTVEKRNQAEEYNRQRFLQRDKKNFLVDFRRFLIDAYTRPPYNTPELESYLQKYISDAEIKENILLEVKRKILLNKQGN